METWQILMAASLTVACIAAAVAACDESRDAPTVGAWHQLDAPPGAPEGTECWRWVRGIGSTSRAGVVCFEANK